MIQDIFEFWSRIPDRACVHPDDKDVMERVESRFEKNCLPIAFFGRLRTAPVVLLFLSPGYTELDSQHPHTEEGRAYYRSQRDGSGRLPSRNEHEPAHNWWHRVVRQFGGDLSGAEDRVAVLNIGAYHSARFNDWHMLTALPSSRVALDYAQFVLFPAAEKGDRVVVCLRSARLWGLKKGNRFGRSLFAPYCTPGGIMHQGKVRETAIRAVQAKLAAA